MKTRLAVALALLLLAAAIGCGGDDEQSSETVPAEAPELTVPDEDTSESPATTEDAPATSTEETAPPAAETAPGSGGETAPAEPPADTPENDTPPPQDSPAERFEQFCAENPGAC